MDSSILNQILTYAPLALALFAVARTYVPPRSREVRALRAEVNELGAELDELNGKVNKRHRVEGVAQAREVRATTRAQRDLLAEEALALVATKQAAAAPQGAPASKEALRALIHTTTTTKGH